MRKGLVKRKRTHPASKSMNDFLKRKRPASAPLESHRQWLKKSGNKSPDLRMNTNLKGTLRMARKLRKKKAAR